MPKKSSSAGTGPRTGYGWLRVGEGSRNPFVIHEDSIHKVRFVVVDNGKYVVRCSRKGCKFRVEGVENLDQANKIAAAHRAKAAQL